MESSEEQHNVLVYMIEKTSLKIVLFCF